MRSLSIVLVAHFLLAPLSALALPVDLASTASLPQVIERRGLSFSKGSKPPPQVGNGICKQGKGTNPQLQVKGYVSDCAREEYMVGWQRANTNECLNKKEMLEKYQSTDYGTCFLSEKVHYLNPGVSGYKYGSGFH